MMIKYRVHEVAKDLDVPNKEVQDALQKYCGDPKKHMTALTEDELDVVFESFTQTRSLPSLDEYFADNGSGEAAEAPAPEKQEAAAPAQKNPVPEKANGSPAEKAASANASPQHGSIILTGSFGKTTALFSIAT